jgi:hypothetical protein
MLFVADCTSLSSRKVLAFATALTLFLPPRLNQWRTAPLAGPGTKQATLPRPPLPRTRQSVAIPGGGAVISAGVMASPGSPHDAC